MIKNKKKKIIIGVSVSVLIMLVYSFFSDRSCSVMWDSVTKHCICIGIEVDTTNYELANRDAEPYTTNCLGINLGYKDETKEIKPFSPDPK